MFCILRCLARAGTISRQIFAMKGKKSMDQMVLLEDIDRIVGNLHEKQTVMEQNVTRFANNSDKELEVLKQILAILKKILDQMMAKTGKMTDLNDADGLIDVPPENNDEEEVDAFEEALDKAVHEATYGE
ncbi:MAG: hypothetical protein IJH67_08170 [Thermoguttaceae bacterium]|nr:hypothetical protein [Thermoguttaceae bacterium]